MKKLLTVLLAVLMVVGLVGCTKKENEGGEEKAAIKVAMISDYGDITDQSFNQTTYEACKAFCESKKLAFTYFKPTADDDAARIEMIDKAVGEGYNVIVMPGYAFAAAVVYGSKTYPDVKFVALDVAEGDLLSAALGEAYDWNPANWNVADYYNTANTYCAVYQEEIAGYFAGYAAVKLGYTKLGFLGGMAVPAVVRYGYGFVQGCNDAAKELGITVDIKYAYGNQFYGDSDITAAMDVWYQAGTEVVFACGGGIFTSACEAASKVGAKVIGVDVDQKATIDGLYGAGLCVTSAMKGLANTVDLVLGGIVDDKWANFAGKIENLGMVTSEPYGNYVGIPATTAWNDSFKEADYAALVGQIYNGTIKVSNSIEAMPATTNANVDNQGNIK